MPLRSARLIGDPVLNQCFDGLHRMEAPEDNLSVMRLQSGLIEVGYSVGPAGADGKFGAKTGEAVRKFKIDHHLSPTDPVVGPGTSKALDDALFSNPPSQDPSYGQFAPIVVDKRLEQFIALELHRFLQRPSDWFQHDIAQFVLSALSTRQILGIMPDSRRNDIKSHYLLFADPDQPDGSGGTIPREQWFDMATLNGSEGITVPFTFTGVPLSFIIVLDDVVLGRYFERFPGGRRAWVRIEDLVAHETTHSRNLAGTLILTSIPDTDEDTYTNLALAQSSTASGSPTNDALRSFVHEMNVRHVEWIVRQEDRTQLPGSFTLQAMDTDALAAAALFYFNGFPSFTSHPYIRGINQAGRVAQFDQLAKWLRLTARQTFSGNAQDQLLCQQIFEEAADACQKRVTNPIVPLPDPWGLYPLEHDFF